MPQRSSVARPERSACYSYVRASPWTVTFSAHRCEKCARCFVAVDKLDRHRLRCLPTGAGLAGDAVVVRSLKAFSGFEGVVASSQKDKWEGKLTTYLRSSA